MRQVLNNINSLIYWEIYQEPEINVKKISQNIGVYRRRVYEGMESLEKIGLLEKVKQTKIKYKAKPAQVIGSLLKEKQYQSNKAVTKFSEILPNLIATYHQVNKAPTIKIYEGENRFKYLLNTILEETEDNTTICAYNENDLFYDLFDLDYVKNVWAKKRAKKNCLAKVLLNGESSYIREAVIENRYPLSKIKLLKNTQEETSTIWILGLRTVLWDSVSIKAISIENYRISTLLQNVFEIIWNQIQP